MTALLLGLCLDNVLVLPSRTGLLANPTKNTLYTAAVTAATLRGVRSTHLAALLPLASIVGSHPVIPALTNTLFSVHPPLLYVSAALTIASIALRTRRLTLYYSLLWGLSIALGGYWSLQELSWGGW
jgi:hypothetical protein